jgi:hypothetical protein
LWQGSGRGIAQRTEKRKEEASFSEEKEAKRLLFPRLLIGSGHGLNRESGGGLKVFCFFSPEKKKFFIAAPVLLR